MREAGETLLLVALEEVDADRRRPPRGRRRASTSPTSAEHREVLPRRPGDEQHRAERGEVDERRAEVGLGEDEHDREARRGRARAAVVPHARSARRARSAMKPASARTKSSFPNSEGWKVKKPTLIQRVDPRAARPTHEHDRDQADGADEDRAPVAPVEVGVDAASRPRARSRRRRRRRSAGRGSSSGCPGRRSFVTPAIAQSPTPTSAGDAGEQDPVERAQDARRAPAPRRAGRAAPSVEIRRTRASVGVDRAPAGGALTWKNFENTRSAAGAAAVPPWPPFSITAQTTIFAVVASARTRTTRTGSGHRGSRAGSRPSPPCRSCRRSTPGTCRRRRTRCRTAMCVPS